MWCLERILIFGRRHPEQVLKEFIEHYHYARRHQVLEQVGTASRSM